MTIMYIVIAALVGAAITYFLFPRKKTITQEVGTTDDTSKQALDEAKQSLEERDKQVAKLKADYQALSKETEERVQLLNKQLQESLKGKVDPALFQNNAEVDKLKKQIKNLQDDIEDMEDDLDSQKKKAQNKERELIQTIDAKESENKKLQQTVESIKSDLEQKKQELSLKMQSLDFVKEILTAQPIGDEKIKKLYSSVDDVCDYVKLDIRDLAQQIVTFPDANYESYLFFGGLYKWASTIKKSWIANKTTVAFVGEFSAGKTSIVNRILSQDNPNESLLPVSTKATTAIPTYISGGASKRFSFFSPDNKLKYLSEATFKRVNKEVLGQIDGISSLIQYFVMTYKNPNLEKLSILDTPGFNSNDRDDAERTIGVINECDALFWVFDVNAGTVNRSSINVIKEHLNKPLYVVINKVDTKAENEVNKVEQLIRQTLRDAGITVQKFIRFSKSAPLNNIMEPIKQCKANTKEDDYIAVLNKELAHWVDLYQKSLKDANSKYYAAEKKL